MLKKYSTIKNKISADGKYVFVLYNLFESIKDNYFFDANNSDKYKKLIKYFDDTIKLLKKDNLKLNKEFLDLE